MCGLIYKAATLSSVRGETKIDKLSSRIEAGIKEAFSFDVPTLVRDVSYFKEVIDNNPFPRADS